MRDAARPLALVVEDEPDIAALLRELVEEEDEDDTASNAVSRAAARDLRR